MTARVRAAAAPSREPGSGSGQRAVTARTLVAQVVQFSSRALGGAGAQLHDTHVVAPGTASSRSAGISAPQRAHRP